MKKEEPALKRLERSMNFLRIVGVSVLWLLLSALIVPFAPATVAMYHAILRSVRQGEGKFFHVFFASFRAHFKRSAPIGIFYLALSAALLFCIRFANILAESSQIWLFLSYVYTGILILLGMIGCFLFPTFEHCDQGALACAKIGLILSFKHLFTSATCFLLLYIAGWLALRFPACLLLLPGGGCYIATMLLEPYFAKAFPPLNEESQA